MWTSASATSEISLWIRPAWDGWRVECDLAEAAYFQSGARAEESARDLAMRLRDAGRDVRLTILDHAETPIAQHRYAAQ